MRRARRRSPTRSRRSYREGARADGGPAEGEDARRRPRAAGARQPRRCRAGGAHEIEVRGCTRARGKVRLKIQVQFRAAEVSKQASRDLDEVLAPATSETEDAEVEAAAAAVPTPSAACRGGRRGRGFRPRRAWRRRCGWRAAAAGGLFAPPPDAPRPTPSKRSRARGNDLQRAGRARAEPLGGACRGGELMGVEPTGRCRSRPPSSWQQSVARDPAACVSSIRSSAWPLTQS